MKDAVRWMWSLGDYGAIAVHLEPHAIELAQRSRLQPGIGGPRRRRRQRQFRDRGGSPRRDRGCHRPHPGDGRARPGSEPLRSASPIEWLEADAEQLPFPDERFDVVASVFGAMFAPDPERVAAELFRVTKRGGLVAMANYGPKGFLGASRR